MNIKVFLIALVQLCIAVSSFSQIDSTFKDSIEEIVIYEYDTVYIASDTIRITDTILNIIKEVETVENKSLPTKNRRFFKGIKPESIEISIAPFVSGNFTDKKLSDSLSSVVVTNYSMAVRVNYRLKKYLLTLGVGFMPYREKYLFRKNYYSSNQGFSSDGLYDSLLVSKGYTENLYFNYLNFNLLAKRKWDLNKRISLSLIAGGSTDILLPYKEGNTLIKSQEIRTFDVLGTAGFGFSYRFYKNYEFYVSPFYQRSLLSDKLYPTTSFQRTGIEAGFRLFL